MRPHLIRAVLSSQVSVSPRLLWLACCAATLWIGCALLLSPLEYRRPRWRAVDDRQVGGRGDHRVPGNYQDR